MSIDKEGFKLKMDEFVSISKEECKEAYSKEKIDSFYNKILEFYEKLNFLSEEEWSEIEVDITKLQNENTNLKTECDNYKAQLDNMKKNSRNDLESVNERCKILQQYVDKSSQINKDNEEKIFLLNEEKTMLMTKYQNLIDEMEISNGNVRKFYQIEQQLKSLQEENSKLINQLKNQRETELMQVKINQMEIEMNSIKEKCHSLEKANSELKLENNKFSQENFIKFQKIVDLENELKIKSHKLEEKDTEITKLKTTNSEINYKYIIAQNEIKANKLSFESQRVELQKEIEKLLKSNENLKKENIDLNDQIKKIQNYTNFAKISKDSLSKKDFSILEKMSNRVEELQGLNETLKRIINDMESENNFLKKENKNYEELSFHYINNEMYDLKQKYRDIEIPKEEIVYLNSLKSDPKFLLEYIYTLKRENLAFQKNIETITIECNKLLRENKSN